MTKHVSPGLTVCGGMEIERIRKIPPGAAISVKRGNRVSATDVVATAEVPGQVLSVDAAALLGVPKSRILDYLTVKDGDSVVAEQVIGRRRALMGLMKSSITSPVSGVVENASRVSGHVMIRENPHSVAVNAFISGKVRAADEKNGIAIVTTGALVQGVFGVGGEVTGELCAAGSDNISGKIVCSFESVGVQELCNWRDAGAAGGIVAGIDGRALVEFCGEQFNPAITGDENVGMTLIFTEGFGQIPMAAKTRKVLVALMGKKVSMCGVTQVRAGVIRPELIGPATMEPGEPDNHADSAEMVKIARGRFLGHEAMIVDKPPTPQPLASGVCALVYRVRLLESDTVISVPRANVE